MEKITTGNVRTCESAFSGKEMDLFAAVLFQVAVKGFKWELQCWQQ